MAMKPSGIDWIGDIPDDWEVKKLKYVTVLRNESDHFHTDSIYLGLENIESSTGKYIQTETEYIEGFYNVIKKGDILFGKLRPYLEKVYISDIDGFCTGEFLNFKKFEGEKRYLFYFLLNHGFIEIVNSSTYGAKMPRAEWNYIRDLSITMPALQEQKAITTFLDTQCSKIDNIISELEQQIEILKKYKTSLITETITKGLNKDVPMKNSRIDWIGEIPAHWEVKRLKYILKTSLQYGANESGIPFDNVNPRYIRITDITSDGRLKEDEILSLESKIAKPYILKDKDLLFARSGATVGKTFYYETKFGISAFAGYLIKASICQDIHCPRFVYYYTLNNTYEMWKSFIFSQATIQNIGADKYNDCPIICPPLEEQKTIAAYLDTQCKRISEIITEKQKSIDTMKAYKKSLIYEYVTGKKRVKGYL
jgi:restriction endonuclease S subunit